MKIPERNAELKRTVKAMASVADYLWHKGWAERNAGNMSVNVSGFIRDEVPGDAGNVIPLATAFPSLEGQYLLLSGSGTRMRNLAAKPYRNVCLLRIGKGGTAYTLYSDAKGKMMPTSELPTHLAIHAKLLGEGRTEKALLHTHVNELIALTQIREYTSEESINRLLWGMHPETLMFIPQGAGFVPYTLPGTGVIAEKTLEALASHNVVIWEKHGCLAVGDDLYEAFDLIDILAKSAGIFFTCRNAGYDPEGMTEEQLAEIRKFVTSH